MAETELFHDDERGGGGGETIADMKQRVTNRSKVSQTD